MGRGIKVRNGCIERVKLAVKRNGYPSQAVFATRVGFAKATVDKFLNGKAVDFATFEEICEKLALDWQEVADLNNDAPIPDSRSQGVALDAATSVQTRAELTIEPTQLSSDFYIERPPVEELCSQMVKQPGALIRIKASGQMGKTALMSRILSQADQLRYTTTPLSFQLADSTVFSDLNTFLRWFCAVVTKEIGLVNRLDEYWEDIFACNFNTTTYFQKYLLTDIANPLVLALDNTDLVFEKPQIATDFCHLLRNWHDQARRSDRTSQIWQKLRLVIVHATEIYGALDINSSPLAGVGVVVELPEFNTEQVQNLAQQHGLAWTIAEVEKIMNLVGGHPYLLQLAFDQIKRQGINLDLIISNAYTEAGIYSNHLRQHLLYLENSAELVEAFKKVVTAEKPVPLKAAQAFKLQSIGLVKLEGNNAKPRYRLYREYFRNHFSS